MHATSWDGRCSRGQSAQRAPTRDTQPQRLQNPKIWAAPTQTSPTRIGTRSPRTPNLPHPVMQTCRGPAGERSRPRPRRGDRRSVPGSAAGAPLRSACRRRRSLQAGCCLSRGARSIGPPKPTAGGNRRKVARVRGGAGTIRSPQT